MFDELIKLAKILKPTNSEKKSSTANGPFS